MGFNKVYRSLFNVEILHHYFLDEGEDVYDSGLDADKMETNLAAYDLSTFMKVVPTTKTIQTLKNFRSKFIQTKQGFQVAMASDGDEPFIPFSSNLQFDFIARVTDQFFENYTDITIDRSVPLYLSNQAPTASTEDTAISVRFCPLSDFETGLTNGVSPTAPMVEIDIDLDDIDGRELIGAFAVIRIHLTGDVGEITLTNGATEFNGTLPEVNWIFDNRSTTWKYHRSKDSVQVHASTGEKPLTKHGYIAISDGSTDYPNPSAKMIYDGEDQVYKDLADALVTEDVTKKYSRIFI
jgi:hypothetical protein